MDDKLLDEIKGMVEALDAKVPSEGAAIQFVMGGGTPDESRVEANTLGYMRMGIWFLKAGCAAPEKLRDVILPELDKFVYKDSEVNFVSAALKEELRPPPSPTEKSLKDRIALVGCALVAFVAVVLMIGGVLFWCGVSRGR
jgi:hypothetical protein